MRSKPSSLAGSGALLLLSMTVVNAGNYLFNLLLGRQLGPAAFADLSLLITLMLLVSFVATALAQATARFSAIHTADGDAPGVAAVRKLLVRWAFIGGGALLALLVMGAPLLQRFFQTRSAWPFVILGLGMPLFLAQGVERGVLQGQTRFLRLAGSYQAEMWMRLGGGVLLVAAGWGVNGAVVAITASFVASWSVASRGTRSLPAPSAHLQERRAVVRFMGPVMAALVGQVLINNSDIILVKHFFAAPEAGAYAALALIGRIVFFATWSVVTAMFPVVAQKEQRGERHRHLLGFALLLVGAVSAVIIVGTTLAPELIVRALFGAAYLSIAPLLALYAITTALYALGNVVINYRLSAGDGTGTVAGLAGGMAQVAGLWLFHETLRQVVYVQLVIMAVLLVGLLAWDLWLYVDRRQTVLRSASS
ncbi:MAG: oligosaccharide flippase family protein [Herpetosiphon sp.]